MKRIQLFTPQPYDERQLNSGGRAVRMMVREFNFPKEHYAEDDTMIYRDLDRILQQRPSFFAAILCRHTGMGGEGSLYNWFARASHEEVMAFLIDILEADQEVNWTGYRILATIHGRQGYIVWHVHLYAQSAGNKDAELSTQAPYAGY